MRIAATEPAPASGSAVVSLIPSRTGAETSVPWRDLRQVLPGPGRPSSRFRRTPMEARLAVLEGLAEAPPRTLHLGPIVRSSPLPPSVREMLERRDFGRPHDASRVALEALEARLPGLACPEGDVEFLASDGSFEDLSLSVDCLLQHRQRLLAGQVDLRQPRRRALVLGAGPGGLMVAIQLRLRGHQVVVCEAREAYSRNRYIGVYKEVTHLMAALGMPEAMTYDFSQYRGKRGIMLADLQTFLHAVALKLGVVIYTGAVCRHLDPQVLRSGEVELVRTTTGTASAPGHRAVGLTRWQHDTVARVRSGVAIRFDTLVEATGGRSGLRELLVGPDAIVPLRTVAREAASRDPSLESFFDDPEDHCAEYVESGYGCPPGLRASFAEALLGGGDGVIPDSLPCFVSNIDASVFASPLTATDGSMGLASRIGDRELRIPHDWVVLECRLADGSLSRYHVEGPLPQTFEFGGTRLPTRDVLPRLSPVGLLLRILYAMGLPFEAIDRRRLLEFCSAESSNADTRDIVSTWIGTFRGLRLGGDRPAWRGPVPGNDRLEYGILGEALQNAWYRFGVGVDDTFAAACRFAEGVELDPAGRVAEALRFERVMTARSVQVLYHLYSVARDRDQGVVGAVLTEYSMNEKYEEDLAEARLREVAERGAEMLATAEEVWEEGSPSLLDRALDDLRESCCRQVLRLLESLPSYTELVASAREPLRIGGPDWRAQVLARLESGLAAALLERLAPLFAPRAAGQARPREERLVELALGRYAWVTPWVRACALRELDPGDAVARDVLEEAAAERDPLVAETARAALAGGQGHTLTTVDKVLVLRQAHLFASIPHERLARVAELLVERPLQAGERVFARGDLGDCLYLVESGSVRVHDGENTLRILGRHDSFGELSLLDARPRSASVTALEPTRLLRLSGADFQALLEDHPDLMRAINRALCRLVRAQVERGGGAMG